MCPYRASSSSRRETTLAGAVRVSASVFIPGRIVSQHAGQSFKYVTRAGRHYRVPAARLTVLSSASGSSPRSASTPSRPCSSA